MNHHRSVLLDPIALQLDREGMTEREDGESGGGGWGGGVGVDYSREAINRGTAIIRGNAVYYIKCPFSLELRVR